MKQKYIYAYIDVAKRFAELSSAKRLQVGAIIVKEDRIISIGYNGMPPDWTNECENVTEDGTLKTKPEVIHAEANAILKVAKSTQTCEGATLYITLSPCKECSKLIHQAGIKRVVYQLGYRDTSGVDFLAKAGVIVEQIEVLD
jgi:dCMP deaminase